jgi:hypothetical protein
MELDIIYILSQSSAVKYHQYYELYFRILDWMGISYNYMHKKFLIFMLIKIRNTLKL